jgi:hypothetical protein
MSRLGHGGPGLSNATFNFGVASIRNQLEANLTSTLEFERAKGVKTFADYHGDALAQQMFLLCHCADDAGLPPVHALLLKTRKAQQYGVLGSLFAQRAVASPVPLTSAMAPIATPRLVDDVFRSYAPGNDGMTFGKGLSPFAVVCPCHEGIALLQQRVQQAQLVEGGASVALGDAAALLSDNVLFPTQPYIAVEKLYGWSVILDVFLGVNHALSINVRTAVCAIGPLLQRLASHMGDTPGAGMELICRVMFDMQQDVFMYINQVQAGAAVLVPTFETLKGLVTTFRADSLSPLPGPWYAMTSCPKGRSMAGPVAPVTAPAAARTPASAATVVNAHVDRRLHNRYKDSGHLSITAMIGGRTLTFPQHAGKPVCMAWALKGSCSSSCKRAAQHVRYSQDTVRALHTFMDDCGVANPQA